MLSLLHKLGSHSKTMSVHTQQSFIMPEHQLQQALHSLCKQLQMKHSYATDKPIISHA